MFVKRRFCEYTKLMYKRHQGKSFTVVKSFTEFIYGREDAGISVAIFHTEPDQSGGGGGDLSPDSMTSGHALLINKCASVEIKTRGGGGCCCVILPRGLSLEIPTSVAVLVTGSTGRNALRTGKRRPRFSKRRDGEGRCAQK